MNFEFLSGKKKQEQKPEPTPMENGAETNPEAEKELEMTAEEIAEIEKTAEAAVREELAVLAESQDEAMQEGSIEESKETEKETRGKLKKAMLIALASLTAFSISTCALTKKAEAFNVRFGVVVDAPVVVEQPVYCAPQVVGIINVVDQFGNLIERRPVVKEVCTRVIGGGGVFIGAGGRIGGGRGEHHNGPHGERHH
jgi:hypothetical protein